MSSIAQAHPGNPRSNEVMPGLSSRAQALLAPRQHTQFTRAVRSDVECTCDAKNMPFGRCCKAVPVKKAAP